MSAQASVQRYGSFCIGTACKVRYYVDLAEPLRHINSMYMPEQTSELLILMNWAAESLACVLSCSPVVDKGSTSTPCSNVSAPYPTKVLVQPATYCAQYSTCKTKAPEKCSALGLFQVLLVSSYNSITRQATQYGYALQRNRRW